MIRINYGLPNLCAAIVLKAAEDYADAKQELPEAIKNKQYAHVVSLRKKIVELQQFFKSQYCSMLCMDGVSGEEIMHKIDAAGTKWRAKDGFNTLR